MQPLAKLSARSLTEALDELLKRRQASDKKTGLTLPLATFILTGGQSLSGWLLDVRTHEGQSTLLVHVPGPERRHPNADVAFLDRQTLQALVIHEADTML